MKYLWVLSVNQDRNGEIWAQMQQECLWKHCHKKGCKLFPTMFETYFFGILNAAAPSVLNPNNPSVPETRYCEGGVKISIDVNEQMLRIREFCSTEEIAGLIVLGSCAGPGQAANWWEQLRWWGHKSTFQTGNRKSTFNPLVGLDCEGILRQISMRSVPVPTNRIVTSAAYLRGKIDFTTGMLSVLCRIQVAFYNSGQLVLII